jgi:uncharacterized protein YecE (DUF72 family)
MITVRAIERTARDSAVAPTHNARRAVTSMTAAGAIRVGTSGYSFKDWVGPFYPAGTRPDQQLEFYTRAFDCLEVNVTYYRVPDARLLAGIERRTPEGFALVVKLHGDITHRHSRDKAVDSAFHEAVQPLHDAGKMHGLLAQFPYSFRNTQENRGFVAELRDRFPDESLFVEFRRDEWAAPPVFSFLRALRVGWVCVDEPALPGLVPPVAVATTDVAYVRLHGRNARDWYGSGTAGADRYDYSYKETELREWATKVHQLARETRQTFVFFNNCHGGQAPANAAVFQGLLGL